MSIHPDDLARIQQLSRSAPVTGDVVPIDWNVYEQALNQAFPGADAVVTASWCRFGKAIIEALVDSPNFAIVGHLGIFVCSGKKKMMGLGGPAFDQIPWSKVSTYGQDDYVSSDGRTAKFVIEFAGPGGIFLGRLNWQVFAKRFQQTRNDEAAMNAARERDRVYNVIEELLSA
ncbi:hypothetical protein ACFFOM_10070 [Microlunatus capsulatus]|uniref:Uncharacterized protein n=1 Tax=Microlunatus capsulatus TaxID=99117 RepID=A0ABS4ZAB0_9ACTN|nr:hypothetical protein [Microlunatus capsulatus]MBP2417919.1 hypothetical protein [Microlunatus capsulatus]